MLIDCTTGEVTRPAIEQALTEDNLLWLDIWDTDEDTIALLREVFRIHPLAIEDAQEFDQRPKVEDYDDFVNLVAYGMRGRAGSLAGPPRRREFSFGPNEPGACRPARPVIPADGGGSRYR